MSAYKKIAVLMGGWCAEREISLISGRAASDALREQGYLVEDIDVTRNIVDELKASFGGEGPDAVFNALHGPYGEDGRVQSVLEILEIPYTHSGVLSSALCMDKPRTKAVLAANGLRVPGGKVIATDTLTGGHPLELPYVLKPTGDGSSFGVFIIKSDNESAPVRGRSNRGGTGDRKPVQGRGCRGDRAPFRGDRPS